MRDTLTTYEIATLCGVDITTVINWVNCGKLSAFKTPGGHRRIRVETFLEFIKSHNMPVPRGLKEKSYSILVVDDDEHIIEFLRAALDSRYSDIIVWDAQDGFSAGKLLAEKLPDLVILDMKLPGIDGCQVSQLIRSDRRLKSTKILSITAYDSEESRKNARISGADDYLIKPFTSEEFFGYTDKLIPEKFLKSQKSCEKR
jgi:two-component system, OmpR family, response regulator VicR